MKIFTRSLESLHSTVIILWVSDYHEGLKIASYGTAFVQCCKYVHATWAVAACGPRMYLCDTQFMSNL